MRDDQAAVVVIVESRDALRDDLHGIDVEAGVRLVEQRELRLEHEKLEDFVALLLAAREADVHIAISVLRRNLELFHHRAELLAERQDFDALARDGLLGRANHVLDRDARDFFRRLKREEQSLARTLERLHRREVFAFEQHLSARDRVFRMTHDDVHERRFAGTVRAENDMHFALADREG